MRYERSESLIPRLRAVWRELDDGSQDYIRDVSEVWQDWSYEEQIKVLEFMRKSCFHEFTFMEIAALFTLEW